ncbi:MAG TPA: FxSxx-COOH system tetratricopeptide repeat protein, partial [Kineosporiaceae bacterium]
MTEAGYAVELDVWDWAPGQDFVARMQAALSTSGRLLAVWSAAYFQSVFGTAELRAAFVQQAREAGRVVPVMVERVAVPELFASLIYVDLVGLDEVAAAAWLRARLAGGRPKVAPRFPAAVAPSGDRPAFAGAWPAVWTAPPRNPHFVGRATMLSELRQRLRSEGHMLVVQSLYGLGGVGKTQLAIEYVHRFAADYTLVWWLDAEQPILVGGQLAALAARLGLSDGGLTEQTVRNVMDMLRRRQDWLLIFDNAQRPQDVTPYLPGGTGHILITSRQPGFGALGGRMEVDVLQRPETVALLRRRLPELDDQLAHELAAELGDLPLAAAQAAGYLESTGLPATDYLARFRGHRDSVLARGEVLGYQGRLDTTWKLSLERLNVDSPAAVALLRLAAFLAPEPFPVQVLNEHSEVLADPLRTAAADPDELDDVVGRIVGFSLARREGDNLHLHRLVQAAIRHDLTPEVRRQEQQRALSLLGVAHPGNPLDPTTWPRYRQLAAHILLTAPLSDDRADNRRLLCDTARYLQATGNFPASRAMTEELLSRWQAAPLLGPDDPDTLEAAAILACTHVSVGDDVRAAYGLSSATVERAGRVLGPDHPTTAWAAATWIIARLRMGERFPSAGRAPAGDQPREDALEHDLASLLEKGREAVSRARQVLGPDHWVTL